MDLGRFNWQLWTGFVLSPIAFLSYPFLFVRWPATRDVPWVNVLLVAAAVALLVVGVRRAFAPGRLRTLRMAISLAIAALSAAILGAFVMMVFVAPRRLPASTGAPNIGERAPDFRLPDDRGTPTTLSDLLAMPIVSPSTGGAGKAPKGVLLIFYMYSGCRACNSEFRGVQQNLGRLFDAGIRPVAISIDPPETSRRLSEDAGYTFSFLSDPTESVIRRYDVGMGETGARPAEFLLDSQGIVRWRNLTTSLFVRARPEQMLAAAATLR